MKTLTLRLKRPEREGGVEIVTVAYNGHIEEVEYQPHESYSYLWERTPQQREERLRELLGL